MGAKRLDGKALGLRIEAQLAKRVAALKDSGVEPHLAVVLAGDDPASHVYVRNKQRACERCGIKSTRIDLPSDVSQDQLMQVVIDLNSDDSVHGILVQSPTPTGTDELEITAAIDPAKDVDGFHPVNVGNLSSGYESSVPCTPLGCYLLIKKIEPNLSGKKAVIVGRSNLNGKPMTQLLLKENCTVTITHSKTKNLKEECLEADIIVAAVGIPELIKGDWVKKDSIVIDVGINKTENGLVGDVAFDEVSKVAKALTPVPGGVGPMTIACLLKNTIDCFKRSQI